MSSLKSSLGGDSPLAAVRSDHHCFGCGDLNPIGLHLRFATGPDGVRAAFVPTAWHQGFQGIVHGGIVTSLLDEAMAWATAHAGYWAVTGELRVRYRRPLSVGDRTTVSARITGVRGKIVTTTAELVLDRDGSRVATATATFVRVDDAVAAEWRSRYLVAPES
jgi:uncharacterized protein (TIGR00369 family)